MISLTLELTLKRIFSQTITQKSFIKPSIFYLSIHCSIQVTMKRLYYSGSIKKNQSNCQLLFKMMNKNVSL